MTAWRETTAMQSSKTKNRASRIPFSIPLFVEELEPLKAGGGPFCQTARKIAPPTKLRTHAQSLITRARSKTRFSAQSCVERKLPDHPCPRRTSFSNTALQRAAAAWPALRSSLAACCADERASATGFSDHENTPRCLRMSFA